MMPLAMLLWSPQFLKYNFGPGHPMSPTRLALTMQLLEQLGLMDHIELSPVDPADRSVLELVHGADYVSAIESGGEQMRQWGLGSEDTPIFPDTHVASSHIVGASVAGAYAVWRGQTDVAINLAGGMHHAMPRSAAGFCVYNDPAIAIASVLELGAKRIAYIDIDAHHGDGVERAFWDDPRVMTISIHQHGSTLFPGTGFPQDVGSSRARGTAVNIAVAPGTSDAAWLRAFDAVSGPLLAEFQPQLIVSQHGCDAHVRDPITRLDVSVDAQRQAALLIRQWAREHADGKWLALGGGGYDIMSTVPRVWAHLVAICAGVDLAPSREVPGAWQEQVGMITEEEPPATMGDDRSAEFTAWGSGFNPDSEIDRAIMATRRCVFPEHGLDPHLD